MAEEKIPAEVQWLRDARDEQDAYAKENDLPTYEEIEAARAAGRASGLVFGTGVPTSVGDFTITTADSLQLAEAVAETVGNREELREAGVRDAGDPEQVGAAADEVEGRNPVQTSASTLDGGTVTVTSDEDDDGDPNTRTAKEIIADLQSADSTEKVDELAAEGANFKTVQDAVEKRRAELQQNNDDVQDAN